jgi:hypothetical protein
MKIEKVKSWYIIENRILIKVTDKSFFKGNSTGIPALIVRHCIGADEFSEPKKDIKVQYEEKLYNSYFIKKQQNRMYLVFDSDLTNKIIADIEKNLNGEKFIYVNRNGDDFPLVIISPSTNRIDFEILDSKTMLDKGLRILLSKVE